MYLYNKRAKLSAQEVLNNSIGEPYIHLNQPKNTEKIDRKLQQIAAPKSSLIHRHLKLYEPSSLNSQAKLG